MQIVLDHIVLNVADINRAVDFYHDILGLEQERLTEYRQSKAPFPSVRINDSCVIDLFPPEMWQGSDSKPGGSNLNHFCLTLNKSEWHKMIGHLADKKIAIHRESDNNWGARGIGVSAYFYDPDGNEIEIRYYPEA